LALGSVPFLLRDGLSNGVIGSVEYTPSPSSWKLGRRLPLVRGVLYSKVL
jgi:hypothetical protein